MEMIIDGPDNSGKTTFAKRMAEIHGIDYAHMNYDDPRLMNFYFHTMAKSDIVWDRHFISEYVYAKIFNRPTEINDPELSYLINRAKHLGVTIVICVSEEYDLSQEGAGIRKNQSMIHNEFIRIAEGFNPEIRWKGEHDGELS